MSRAMKVNASGSEVTRMCVKLDVEISSLETLVSGGTRVVLKNGDAAEVVRRAYGSKVFVGTVTRAPIRLQRS